MRRESEAGISAQLVVLAFFLLFLAMIYVWGQQARVVAPCEEDQVLYGTGQFEAGRWSQYECGPVLEAVP